MRGEFQSCLKSGVILNTFTLKHSKKDLADLQEVYLMYFDLESIKTHKEPIALI